MEKFTAREVQLIIEADRAGRICLEPRDYTDETLAAALQTATDPVIMYVLSRKIDPQTGRRTLADA